MIVIELIILEGSSAVGSIFPRKVTKLDRLYGEYLVEKNTTRRKKLHARIKRLESKNE